MRFGTTYLCLSTTCRSDLRAKPEGSSRPFLPLKFTRGKLSRYIRPQVYPYKISIVSKARHDYGIKLCVLIYLRHDSVVRKLWPPFDVKISYVSFCSIFDSFLLVKDCFREKLCLSIVTIAFSQFDRESSYTIIVILYDSFASITSDKWTEDWYIVMRRSK